MTRSRRPTISQLRRLYLLCAECVELGRDPLVWRKHLAEGIMEMIPDTVVLVYELFPSRLSGDDLRSALIDVGWADDSRKDVFEEYLDSGDTEANPLLNWVLDAHGPTIAVRAMSLLAEQEWLELPSGQYMRECGIELNCLTTASAQGPKRNVLTIHRQRGTGELSPRELTVIKLIHRELEADMGVALASFGEPSVLELTPSVRAVLLGLLQGESLKETSHRLGLSEHTARDYTKVIHRHFGVSSRAELLADLGGIARSPHGQRILDHLEG